MEQGKKKANKTILVIDTSTAMMSLALMSGEQLIIECNQTVNRRHSDMLLPAIEGLLQSAHMTMQDIDGIAVGRGPGSYTGVRIGVTAAKTLAWTLGVPLIGISSLEALAQSYFLEGEGQHGQGGSALGGNANGGTGHEGARHGNTGHGETAPEGAGQRVWVVPLVDARRERAYTAIYEAQDEAWQCVAADRVQPIDTWLKQIRLEVDDLPEAERPRHIVFIGELSPFSDHLQKFQEEMGGECVQFIGHGICPITIGRIAQQRWHDESVESIHHFVPNYTQLAEAEVNLAAKRM